MAGKHRKPTKTKQKVAKAAIATAAGAGVLTVSAAPAYAGDEWSVIAECESGGNNIESHSTASSASGFFQIIDGTWRGAGGLEFAPRAIQATYDQQLIVAKRIAEARGSLADWDASKSCWGDRISAAVPPPPVIAEPQHAPPVDGVITYVVQKGDQLRKIASKVGMKTMVLYDLNKDVIGDNPNIIMPGQILKVTGMPVAGQPIANPDPVLSPASSSDLAVDSNATVHPVPGAGVSSEFGPRGGSFHAGIDIDGRMGDPIYAVSSGEVISAGPARGFGNWIRIKLADGTIHIYGHMKASQLYVSVGEQVVAGEHIADVGAEGDVRSRNGDGSHLHFGVEIGPGPINPRNWLEDRGVRL